MREALIICPKRDNAGADLSHVVTEARRRLVRAFGGCTARDAEGAWEGPDGTLYVEPVTELVAAAEDNAQAHRELEAIADYISREGSQLAVYIRYPNGAVAIRDTLPRAREAA